MAERMSKLGKFTRAMSLCADALNLLTEVQESLEGMVYSAEESQRLRDSGHFKAVVNAIADVESLTTHISEAVHNKAPLFSKLPRHILTK